MQLSPSTAQNRGSLTSDLYAEISSGQNSTRSSTYAQVNDMHVFEFPNKVRDALNKKLTEAARQNAEGKCYNITFTWIFSVFCY